MTRTKENVGSLRSFEEIEAPDFFRFEKIGDMLEGELLSKEPPIEGRKFGMYSLRNNDMEVIRFHGSAKLDDLLQYVEVGMVVQIEFIDQKKMTKGTMKLFTVRKLVGS